jgi:hypothetical protein
MKPLSYAALTNSAPVTRFEAKTSAETVPINRLLTESADKASLQRAASLPVIITQGSAQGAKRAPSPSQGEQVPGEILAYAPAARIQGNRSAATAKVAISEASLQVGASRNESRSAIVSAPSVPARLDRSNFKTLTANADLIQNPVRTSTGPLALRSSARATTDLLDGTPPDFQEVMVFAATATALPTDHFTGKTFLDGRSASLTNK